MSTIHGDKVVVSHEYGGCTFNDPGALNTYWPGAMAVAIDEMAGWRSTTALTVIRTERGTGDGDYLAERFPKRSRMLTIDGYLTAPDRLTLDKMFDLVVANAFPNDTDITLTRHEPIPKYVTGRLAGEVEEMGYLIDPRGVDAMRWQTTLLCPDPLKYDALNDLSGSTGVAGLASGGRTYPRRYPLQYNVTASGEGNQVVLYNTGTTDSPVVARLHGPLPIGWRLELGNTGEQISFATALVGPQNELVIDTGNKTATLDGNSINGLLGGTWWRLKPKGNVVRLYGNYDPAAGFSITAKSAWR